MTYQEPPSGSWQPPQGQPGNPIQLPPGAYPTQQLPPAAYPYVAPGQPPAGPPRAPRSKPGFAWWIIPITAVIFALLVGIAIGSSGKKSKSAADTGVISTATVTVTASAAPVAAVTVTASAAAAPKTTPAAAKTTAAAPAGAKTVLALTGNGSKQTGDFTVTQSQWTIAYTYDCTAFGQQGNFSVDIYDQNNQLDFNKPGPDELGEKGNSSTIEHGNGTYYLSVTSECNWTINVTG